MRGTYFLEGPDRQTQDTEKNLSEPGSLTSWQMQSEEQVRKGENPTEQKYSPTGEPGERLVSVEGGSWCC